MRSLKIPLFSIIVSSLALLLASCTPHPPSDAPRGRIRIQSATEPVTLDPSNWEDGFALRILSNVLDPLWQVDAQGQMHPLLVKDVKTENHGQRFRITLKNDIHWSNGDPITGEDFVYGIKKALDRNTSGKLTEMLWPIKNSRDYFAGKATELGAHAQGQEIILELEKPTPYFLKTFSLPFTPLHKDYAKGVVSGPYRIKERKIGQFTLLEANENDWNPERKGKSPEIELLYVQNDSTALQLFYKKKISVLTRIESLDFPKLKSEGYVWSAPFAATYFVGFNTRKPPFDKKEVRRAFVALAQQENFTQVLLTGELPARSWVPPGFEGYWPLTRKKITAPLPTQKIPGFEIGYDHGERNQILMERLQAVWAEGSHAPIKLMASDWKSFIKGLETDPPAVFRFGWLAAFADSFPHLRVFAKGNPNNYTGWSSPQYDRWLDQMSGLPSGPERAAIIEKMQHLLLEDEAVIIPIYHYIQAYGLQKNLQGFEANMQGIIPFWKLRETAPSP